jgi:hypothetical protein
MDELPSTSAAIGHVVGVSGRSWLGACSIFVATMLGFGSVLLVVASSPVLVNVEAPASVEAPAPLDLTHPGMEVPETLTVDNAAATELELSSGVGHVSWSCVNNSTNRVYVVPYGATGTTEARGPFCTDSATCPAGAVFGSHARRAFALSPDGDQAVNCGFLVP